MINVFSYFIKCVERIVNARGTSCTGPQEHIIGKIYVIFTSWEGLDEKLFF